MELTSKGDKKKGSDEAEQEKLLASRKCLPLKVVSNCAFASCWNIAIAKRHILVESNYRHLDFECRWSKAIQECSRAT